MRLLAILSIFLFCESNYSQQNENPSQEFNRLINYIPSSLNNENFESDLEKKYSTKFNNVNIIFNLALSEETLTFTEKEFSVYKKQIEDLVIALNKDGILFLLRGYTSHGCNPISKEIINQKKIKIIMWCYGHTVKNDEAILKFFEIFNNQVKRLL